MENKRISNNHIILDSERRQFETYKDMSEKKLELANKELDQKCDRFKEVMKGFTVKFNDMNDKE